MARHQHGRAGVTAGQDQVADHGAPVGVEPLLGLVEDQQAGRPEPGERQPEQLALSGGQLVGEALAHGAEAEGVELPAAPAPRSGGLAAPRRVDEGQVVGEGEVAVGRRWPDERPRRSRGWSGGARRPGRRRWSRARGGGEQPGDEPQQGGLARPVRAAHHDARPGLGDQAEGASRVATSSTLDTPSATTRHPGTVPAATVDTSASPCTGRRNPSAADAVATRPERLRRDGIHRAKRGVPGVRHRG